MNPQINLLKLDVEALGEILRRRGLDLDSVIPRLRAAIYPRYEAWTAFGVEIGDWRAEDKGRL